MVNSDSYYTDWGDWSGWSASAVSESDTRQVETKWVEPTYRTLYNYNRYNEYNYATGRSARLERTGCRLVGGDIIVSIMKNMAGRPLPWPIQVLTVDTIYTRKFGITSGQHKSR